MVAFAFSSGLQLLKTTLACTMLCGLRICAAKGEQGGSSAGVSVPVVLFLCTIGASLIWPSTLPAQNADAAQKAVPVPVTTPAVVNSLAQQVKLGRTDVRRRQSDYVRALGQPSGGLAASDYVELLRQELKDSLRATVRNSSEVEFAVKRAAVEHRLTLINAYETALGVPSELTTTRFNVFTTAELKQIEIDLKGQLARLAEAASPYPEGATPSQLTGRLRDVRHELDGLRVESALRGAGIGPRVAPLDADLTMAEAEQRFPTLAQLKRDTPALAERLLAVEVEYRRGWSPSDPTLFLSSFW
jgi:hypothetical protein